MSLASDVAAVTTKSKIYFARGLCRTTEEHWRHIGARPARKR